MVYVDNDPVVSVHAEALMAQNHTTRLSGATCATRISATPACNTIRYRPR